MNEKQILQESISDHRKAIETAEAKLAELDKLDLVHGDYGLNREGSPCLMVKMQCCDGDTLESAGTSCLRRLDGNHDNLTVKTRLGNIFDDIAERGKELEKFEVGVEKAGGFKVKYTNRDELLISSCNNDFRTYSLDEAQEICDKLQQVINKAKNRV